jgi:DNA-binding NarL/FixJ family response regulator
MSDPYCIELVNSLTPREREVLIFAAKGATRPYIAQLLGVKPSTIHDHIKSVHEKFNAPTTVECAVIAAKAGIL